MKTVAWMVFLLTLGAAGLLAAFPGFNPVFLTLLFALPGVAVLIRKSFPITIVRLVSVLSGAVFIFSGFVKAVDPVGTQYRIEDYFIAFGTEWALPLALPLSVLLNAFEFITGVLLLSGLFPRFVRWLFLAVMLFFTVVTLNDAINNPVPDCGCFGDALKISNWQTFYKNLILDTFALILFFGELRPVARQKVSLLITTGAVILVIGFEVYNIRHLPVIDFRDWKVGRNLIDSDPEPVQYYLTYRNRTTGETREYRSPDYPYNDSAWLAEWEFVSQRVVDPNVPLHQLYAEDAEGNDVTWEVVEAPETHLIIVMDRLDKATIRNNELVREFISECNRHGIESLVLTSSLPEEAEQFEAEHGWGTPYYFADDITLKAMIRSNPGLILMKEGVVLDKWHHNDWPEVQEVLSASGTK
ncbi:MAG: DoxX family protein [Bacteroidales bacterium]